MLPADDTNSPLDASNVAPLFCTKSIVTTSYTCHKSLHYDVLTCVMLIWFVLSYKYATDTIHLKHVFQAA